jgi:hypothetical protein
MMRFLQEPDAGDLHVRFDEGRVGRTSCRPLSYSTVSAFSSIASSVDLLAQSLDCRKGAMKRRDAETQRKAQRKISLHLSILVTIT